MKHILVVLLILSGISLHAQRGKDGDKVLSGSEVVNAYTSLMVDLSLGDQELVVSDNSLTGGGLPALTAGDLILIIQMQGASMQSQDIFSKSWGELISFNNSGNYELCNVVGVMGSTLIRLDCGVKNAYTKAGKVQVIRVPRYQTLTLQTGAEMTCIPWDGNVGGVVAVEVKGKTTLNNNSKIDVSAKGFRGGAVDNQTTWGCQRFASDNPIEGAEKGEGIGGSQDDYQTLYGGKYSRGAAINGGGGGNCHNSGGGGGANIVFGSNGWNDGRGSIPQGGNAASWELELSGGPWGVSSSGGRGGYSFSGSDKDELLVAPGDGSWGGDQRRVVGGLGGRPLVFDAEYKRLFLGGAGGAGDGNDNKAGKGGNGGGIVLLSLYDELETNGTAEINASGEDGGNSSGPNSSIDAAGGGGAGGSVLVLSDFLIQNAIINTAGGRGGNQIFTNSFFVSDNQAEGPGGSGSGGVIYCKTCQTSTQIIAPGEAGTTNSSHVDNFPENGSTQGAFGVADGMLGASLNTPKIVVNVSQKDSVCKNDSVSFVVEGGNVLGESGTLMFYTNMQDDQPFDAVSGNTDSDFKLVLPANMTEVYVIFCGDMNSSLIMPYRERIDVGYYTSPNVTLQAPATSCAGTSVTLEANGAYEYNWDTTFSIDSTITVVIDTTTTFTVVGRFSNGCKDSTFKKIDVDVCATPIAAFTATSQNICAGDCIDFINNSQNSPTNYRWHFVGLGLGVVNATNPTNVCYNTPGTYDVALVAINSDGLDSLMLEDFITVTQPVLTITPDQTICDGDAVALNASGATGYSWDQGLGVGAIQNVSPNTTTTYTVTGTDANGCQAIDNVTITVNNCSGSAPVAAFSASDSTICVGDCIDFSDLSTGAPTGWKWYLFGNGFPPQLVQDPTNVCYNTPGNYGISLVVSNANGEDSLHIPNFITVENATIGIQASPTTTICSGDAVTLVATGGATYTWNQGLGAGSNHIVSPSVSTNYAVSGVGSNGCSGTADINITVNPCPIPTADFQTQNQVICAGDCITFTNGSTVTGTPSYTWDLPGSNLTNSNLTDPVVCYNTPGLYNVSLTVVDDHGADTKTLNNYITVQNCVTAPVANFDVSDVTICEGDCIDFQDLSTNIPSGWKWYFFGNTTTPTSTSSNPVNICYSTAGTYDVALVSSNSGGSDSLIMYNFITVTVPYTLNTTPDTIVCLGEQVTLTASGADSYDWNNGAGVGPTFTYTPLSNDVVTIEGSNAAGCNVTSQINITTVDCSHPTANFISDVTTICPDECIQFTNMSTGTGTLSYEWSFPGGNPASSVDKDPSVCYPLKGMYQVELVVTDANTTDTLRIDQYISVDSCVPPSGTIYASQDVICKGQCIDFEFELTGGTATNFEWTFPSGSPSGIYLEEPGSVCWFDTGTYTVTLLVWNEYDTTEITKDIVVEDGPIVDAGPDLHTIIGVNVQIDASVTLPSGGDPKDGYFWWFPADFLHCEECEDPVVVEPIREMEYIVLYEDVKGCYTIDTVNVTLEFKDDIGIANSFSPNGDRHNDVVRIRGTHAIKDVVFVIYNRYGQKVYETLDKFGSWDGTFNGVHLNPGVFVYSLTANMLDGTVKKLKGNVTLIR